MMQDWLISLKIIDELLVITHNFIFEPWTNAEFDLKIRDSIIYDW